MKSNQIKVYIFIIIIFIFIFGGFYLMKQSEHLKNEVNQTVTEFKSTDIRTDPTKEYIYYTNVNVVEGELDIEYKDININFEDKNGIQNILNKENEEMSKTPVYDETNDKANYNHLISAKFAKYDIVYYSDYISIVENKFSFNYETIISYLESSAYVFDKNTGKLYSNDELLSKFNINKDDIKTKLTTYLNDQSLINKENPIKVEETINNLSNYELYVDKLGRLVITILVKAEQNDYNDIIVLS